MIQRLSQRGNLAGLSEKVTEPEVPLRVRHDGVRGRPRVRLGVPGRAANCQYLDEQQMLPDVRELPEVVIGHTVIIVDHPPAPQTNTHIDVGAPCPTAPPTERRPIRAVGVRRTT